MPVVPNPSWVRDGDEGLDAEAILAHVRDNGLVAATHPRRAVILNLPPTIKSWDKEPPKELHMDLVFAGNGVTRGPDIALLMDYVQV